LLNVPLHVNRFRRYNKCVFVILKCPPSRFVSIRTNAPYDVFQDGPDQNPLRFARVDGAHDFVIRTHVKHLLH
jgi:hypothetical protein